MVTALQKKKKKKTSATFKFVKDQLDVQQHYWKHVLLTEKTQVKFTHLLLEKIKHGRRTPNPHLYCEAWWGECNSVWWL